jgi:hypothetical protein
MYYQFTSNVRSSSPDISSSPRRTSPSPCPPADLTSSSSSPAVYSSVQVTSPKCSTSRETSIEKDKSSISDGSILADQTSVEGGETSGGSGSARSLELHALRSNDSINGHKVRKMRIDDVCTQVPLGGPVAPWPLL